MSTLCSDARSAVTMGATAAETRSADATGSAGGAFYELDPSMNWSLL